MAVINEIDRLGTIKSRTQTVLNSVEKYTDVDVETKERAQNYIEFAIDNVVLAMEELKKMIPEVP